MSHKLELATNLLMSLACLALTVVLIARLWVGDPRTSAAPSSVQNVEEQGLAVSAARSAVEGNQDAKLVLLEFSDFECPFCARYVRDVYPQLQKEYVASGTVRRVFKNFPLTSIHPFAFDAAVAAECASLQGRYWEMNTRLFENQRQLAAADLRRYAADAGLDVQQFGKCLDDGEMAARVRADEAEATRLGVTSTPTFFVGVVQADRTVKLLRKIVGAQPFSVFSAALNEAANAPAVRYLPTFGDIWAGLLARERAPETPNLECSSTSCEFRSPAMSRTASLR